MEKERALMKKIGVLLAGLLILGACHKQASDPVLFAKKTPTPPLWVSDPNTFDNKKMSGASRNNRGPDWQVGQKTLTKRTENISKTEFAFMRSVLKTKACALAMDSLDRQFVGALNPNNGKPHRTQTFWVEYVSGKKGHYKLTVNYSCLVEGVHKYGQGD